MLTRVAALEAKQVSTSTSLSTTLPRSHGPVFKPALFQALQALNYGGGGGAAVRQESRWWRFLLTCAAPSPDTGRWVCPWWAPRWPGSSRRPSSPPRGLCWSSETCWWSLSADAHTLTVSTREWRMSPWQMSATCGLTGYWLVNAPRAGLFRSGTLKLVKRLIQIWIKTPELNRDTVNVDFYAASVLRTRNSSWTKRSNESTVKEKAQLLIMCQSAGTMLSHSRKTRVTAAWWGVFK